MINLYTTLTTLAFVAADRVKKDEKGATAVEYGLMVGLIAVAIIGAVQLMGTELDRLFDEIGAALKAA